MKRIKGALMLVLILLLTGCASHSVPETVTASVPETTRQAEAPVFYSPEMAMLDGCLVVYDGDVRHNHKEWSDFLEAFGNGEPCEILVVHYTSGENGSSFLQYDLSFDGTEFILRYEQNGMPVTESAPELIYESGVLEDSEEPYDSYEKYSLQDTMLYYDIISEPEYIGVKEIFLHAKEGEPARKEYRDTAELADLLTLLMEAEYVSPPEEYAYGMKLLMTNEDGKQLVIELDLQNGIYRYGQQHYAYGEVAQMLEALGLEAWPEDVLVEFGLN